MTCPCCVSRSNRIPWDAISLDRPPSPLSSAPRAGISGFAPGLLVDDAFCSLHYYLHQHCKFPSILSSSILLGEPGNSHWEEGKCVLLEKRERDHCQMQLGLLPIQLTSAILWNPRLFSDFSAMAYTPPPVLLPTMFSGFPWKFLCSYEHAKKIALKPSGQVIPAWKLSWYLDFPNWRRLRLSHSQRPTLEWPHSS